MLDAPKCDKLGTLSQIVDQFDGSATFLSGISGVVEPKKITINCRYE